MISKLVILLKWNVGNAKKLIICVKDHIQWMLIEETIHLFLGSKWGINWWRLSEWEVPKALF